MAGPFYVDNVLGDDGNSGTAEGAGNAWQTFQHALDTVAAGEICYVKNNPATPYTISATLDIDTNVGTSAAAITYIGYTSTITDKGNPLIIRDGDFINLNCNARYYWFENFIFDGDEQGAKTILSGNTDGDWYTWINVKAMNTGFASGLTGFGMGNNAASWYMYYCEAENCGNYGGFWLRSGSFLLNSYVHDCNGNGIVANAGQIYMIGNVSEANVRGFYLTDNASAGVICLGNTIDGNTTENVYLMSNVTGLFMRNLITNSPIGLNYESGGGHLVGIRYVDWNAYQGNTVDVTNGSMAPNSITLTADPYTDRSNHDFSLNDIAGGGADIKDSSIPVGLLGTSAIGYTYGAIGALQAEAEYVGARVNVTGNAHNIMIKGV